MKVSYNWLKQYIDIPESAEAISQIITNTGLEVESIDYFETIKGSLKDLIIGEVITCVKHHNADKLFITTVHIGTPKLLQIVCGASNVAVGQKVIVAPVGATLHPFEGEPFVIKNATLRDVQSEGMICAEDEIGLGKNHEGIIVLNTSVANGTPAAEYFHVPNDYILEIGLTPNRADAASHIGVARDIKAALKRELKWPSVQSFNITDTSYPIDVTVENNQACPRYSALTISGVTVTDSPDWLKTRLKSIGLSPINNIVDITNFILHETGQPLHAFDANHISGKKIIVKTLAEGTKFKTLDGKERTLTAHDLMICDAHNTPLCIAGVFGGLQSGVTDTTTRIFLESAYFSADYVRKTSLHHGLKTDASFRFERGTDPQATLYALKRAALLITEIAGGKISSELIDIYPKPLANRIIKVPIKNFNRLIGKNLPQDEVFPILERLDIEIVEKNETSFTVSVPPYRVDVTQPADIIEEVLRIYGFNNIELTEIVGTDYFAGFPEKDIHKFKKNISEMLIGNGFYEILTNSLTRAAYLHKYAFTAAGEPVEIVNKLSEDQGVLRQTMLFTGLEVCAYNINRKQKDLKLFEFGKIYWKNIAKEGRDKYEEEDRLAIYLSGNFEAENWQNKPRVITYYDIAQFVFQVLQKSAVEAVTLESLQSPLVEYGAHIMKEKQVLGWLGEIKHSILKDFGIKQKVFYAELSSACLLKQASPQFVVQEIGKFPEVRRDLSLVIDKQIPFAEIKKLVLATEKKLIKDIITFDVYEGNNIAPEKKAYTLGFTLSDQTKTLTDQEIDQTMTKLMAAFENNMGAIIRK